MALSSRSPALGVTQQVWSFGSPDFPQAKACNRQSSSSPQSSLQGSETSVRRDAEEPGEAEMIGACVERKNQALPKII